MADRVLILGGAGMLGHKAYQVLSKHFETWVTFRNFDQRISGLKLFDESKVVNNVDAFSFDSVKHAVEFVQPAIVINCLGVIKQLPDARNKKISIYTNALFPHLLAELCKKFQARLIHISTDCVFSGNKGNYHENDVSDAVDLYGKTKFLGEVDYENTLTLRTSIIGHELFSKVSLVDWFLSQKGNIVKGFTNAIYTGFPTITFANEIKRIIMQFPTLSGLYNLSSEPIAKYELLQIINNVYNQEITVQPYPEFHCNRSLDSSSYRKKTSFMSVKWVPMVEEMHKDYLFNKQRGIYNV